VDELLTIVAFATVTPIASIAARASEAIAAPVIARRLLSPP
jgi:hypothetical protein